MNATVLEKCASDLQIAARMPPHKQLAIAYAVAQELEQAVFAELLEPSDRMPARTGK